jgi:hypothetical protein
MEQSTSGTNSLSVTPELSNILGNPKVDYHVYKSPPLVCILSQVNPVDHHCISLKFHLFINGTTAFFGEPWSLLQFRNLFYTDCRIPWTSDQPVARQLPTQRTTQTHKKHTYRHPCLEWDSIPRSQCSNERRQFMP